MKRGETQIGTRFSLFFFVNSPVFSDFMLKWCLKENEKPKSSTVQWFFSWMYVWVRQEDKEDVNWWEETKFFDMLDSQVLKVTDSVVTGCLCIYVRPSTGGLVKYFMKCCPCLPSVSMGEWPTWKLHTKHCAIEVTGRGKEMWFTHPRERPLLKTRSWGLWFIESMSRISATAVWSWRK